MQPPPQRKGKLVQLLRNVQTEQSTKLQQRYQLQVDLLEDVRSYMKQKCSIERDYAQSLQKLNAQYIQKKDYAVEDESGQGIRSPLKVWKSYLDETENMAKQRVIVAEKEQTDVADKIKAVKTSKVASFKKCQDLFQRIYDELNISLREMSKRRKAYMELQKLAEIAQKETGEAQDKLKKGETFFKSRATLEKNFSKSSERRELCIRQSNASRNEYLLSLASLNGHIKRYRDVDLPLILKDVDGDFYEQIKDYNRTASLLEVEACSYSKAAFEDIVSSAEMISRDASISQFFEKDTVFQKTMSYTFEPYGEDKVSTITTDSTISLAVDKEARKLAMKYVKEQRLLKRKFVEYDALQSKQNNEPPSATEGQQDPVSSLETLQEEIRKVETAIERTEASLELLRSSGVKVDNWIKSAEAQMPPEQTATSAEVVAPTTTKLVGEYADVYESPPQAIGATDDLWDDFDDDSAYDKDDDQESVASGVVFSSPVSAVVLYDYVAVSADELSIVENEEVEVLEKDGEGWCRGRNKSGQVGYFPESYVQISSSPPTTISAANSVSDNLSADFVIANEVPLVDNKIICVTRALFDYDGQNSEELTFEEGAIINILRKDDGEVDDGWWEGELNGRVGVFPSLLVEELENGDDTIEHTEGGEPETTFTYHEERSYANSTTNYYNSSVERTSNLYGTMPRNTPERLVYQEPNVCDSLDLTISAHPARPRLPAQLLRQNMEKNYGYERNEYV